MMWRHNDSYNPPPIVDWRIIHSQINKLISFIEWFAFINNSLVVEVNYEMKVIITVILANLKADQQ